MCYGDPYQTKIFVIGYNPATTMITTWKKYWIDGEYNYLEWEKDYIEQRVKEGKSQKSSTRLRIDRLQRALDFKMLETNIYDSPSKNIKSLKNRNRKSSIVNIIEILKPETIIIHGKKTQKEFIDILKKCDINIYDNNR